MYLASNNDCYACSCTRLFQKRGAWLSFLFFYFCNNWIDDDNRPDFHPRNEEHLSILRSTSAISINHIMMQHGLYGHPTNCNWSILSNAKGILFISNELLENGPDVHFVILVICSCTIKNHRLMLPRWWNIHKYNILAVVRKHNPRCTKSTHTLAATILSVAKVYCRCFSVFDVFRIGSIFAYNRYSLLY